MSKKKFNRTSFLGTADQLINSDRAKVYGPAKKNHEDIAKIWSVILGKEITAEQVVMCMMGLKISRLIKTPEHADSWVDLCAYGAIGGEITNESNSRKPVQRAKRGRPKKE